MTESGVGMAWAGAGEIAVDWIRAVSANPQVVRIQVKSPALPVRHLISHLNKNVSIT